MARQIQIAPGEFYHAYNRGTDKRVIFLDGHDKKRFVKLLYLCNGTEPVNLQKGYGGSVFTADRGESIVDIGAYCLMNNHFHILLHEKKEGGISNYMQKLSTGYTMYFNKKYDRTGSLFEGRFRVKHLNTDNYLKYIFAYIHLNPVNNIDPTWKDQGINDLGRARQYLENYGDSSFSDYLGKQRRQVAILRKDAFPKYFDSSFDFQDFVDNWLTYSRNFTE